MDKKILYAIFKTTTSLQNKVFVISDDNQVLALNVNSGDTLWSHIGNIEEVSILGGSKPAIKGETLVVTYSSGEIYAFNQLDGSSSGLITVIRESIFQELM